MSTDDSIRRPVPTKTLNSRVKTEKKYKLYSLTQRQRYSVIRQLHKNGVEKNNKNK